MPTWPIAAEEFLREKRIAGCSPATIDVYGTALLTGPHIRAWLNERDGTIATIDRAALRSLHGRLLDAGLSAGTRHIYHRTIKTFLRWCAAEGYGVDEAATTGAAPRLAKREPETYTAAQISRLLVAAQCRRDRFLIEMLLRTGLRLGELCALTLDSLVRDDQGRPYLRVRQGKGAKDRVVPVDTPKHKLSAEWAEYVEWVRPKDPEHLELFLSPPCRGRPAGGWQPMTPNGVQMLLTRLARASGVKHVHAHRFRHTWATNSLRAGVDMEALRKAGGWTTYGMVQRYAHYSGGDLVEAWKHRRD